MKKGKVEKFLEWFFAEEKADDSKMQEPETIEINFLQAVMIVVVTLFALFWIFGSHLKSYKKVATLSTQEYIESKIESNYFKDKDAFKNGDFSQGLKHWVSSDGGELFPKSSNIVELDKKDFHSAPYSLKIESKFPANRYHYSKKKNKYTIDNAYGYKETDHWLGVLPGSNVSLSLWYKGDLVGLSVLGLSKEGEWTGLEKREGPKTDVWRQLSLKTEVPTNIRAITLEITLNQAQGMPSPVLWIDDVNMEVNLPD